MELLAPAGSLETFEAAVTAGAAAIYIGAPGANARALSHDFSPAELAALIEYAHARQVKVYGAMNSLLKEDELAAAANTVELLAGLGIDALIIQDLGLHALCRRYFPKLPLHASTLLGTHNSLAVSRFAAMGFSRVVLARELSLAEIETVAAAGTPELEVFVHGAMCFSYSGLCLFSSYGGGRSSTRGRCVQPCRRRYRWGDGKKGGYLFSMNDLEGLAYLPALQQAGVAAVKIEGRLKNAAYVGLVTRAYRLVLDALAIGDPQRQVTDHQGQRASGHSALATAMEEGRELLDQALGRRTATGFFSLPPRELVSPASSGNTGHFLGKIGRLKGRWATFAGSRPVGKGDRLRLHREASGERLAFSVKEVRPAAPGKPRPPGGQAERPVAWRGEILLPTTAAVGDSLYLVDTAASRRAGRRQLVVEQQHQRRAGRVATGKLARQMVTDGWLSRPPRPETAAAPGPPPAKAGRRPAAARAARAGAKERFKGGKTGGKRPPERPLPLWLKVDDTALLKQRLPARVERLLLPLTPESRSRIELGEIPRFLRPRLIWALPPVILEEELPFYRREIAALRQRGFQAWQLGHLGQLQFFVEEPAGAAMEGEAEQRPPKKGQGRRPRRPQELELYGDYTLNILNSLALDNCRAAGLRLVQTAIEGDRANLLLLGQARPGRFGLTIHGRPPLFTARLDSVHFRPGVPLLSPREEEFVLAREGNRTLLLAARPFSLLPHSTELAAAGAAFGVVDLCRQRLAKRDLLPLLRQADKKSSHQPTLSNFNYLHGLE